MKDVSFSIQPGEIFTLLGPNGAGKTTLIRILSGLILPSCGTVTICGQAMKKNTYRIRGEIGLVMGDERSFYFRLSGAQNLRFFGGLNGIKGSVLKQRVREVMQQVGLHKEAGLQFMRYSSGMKKRLSLARALLHDPQVLLLDEPNSSVDPESAAKIREIILTCRRRGKTILLTTHDMHEAERMSDRVGFLREGVLIKCGSVEEFRRLIGKRKLRIEFERGVANTRTTLLELTGELQDTIAYEAMYCEDHRLTIEFNGSFDFNRVMRLVTSKGIPVTTANTIDPSLEDVFIKLAG